jgi:hypothetical protein
VNGIGGFISKYPATPDDIKKPASNSLVQKFLESGWDTSLSFAGFSIFADARLANGNLVSAGQERPCP